MSERNAMSEATKTILRSDEFTCPSCVSKIEKKLATVPGVEEAKVHFNTGRIEVAHDPAQASVDTLVAAVKEAGYTARPRAF